MTSNHGEAALFEQAEDFEQVANAWKGRLGYVIDSRWVH